MELPILYKKMNNKIKFWKISIQLINNKAAIFTEYGFIDGKITKHSPQFIEKSIGNKSPLDRAIQLAKTKWKNKIITDKYSESISNNLSEFHPMKPTNFEKYSNSIQFPAYLQPKLDGVRMFSYLDNGKLKTLSRQSKPISNINHLLPELEKIFNKYPNIVLDGELLINKPYQQKELRGILKKKYINTPNLNKINSITYHIFDIINRNNLEETFSNRWKLSKKIKSKLINIVPTEIIQSKTDIPNKFNKFIQSGYEGAIIRNPNGTYKMGKQSQNLQKIKLYFSEDFTISNFHEGTGDDKGTVIWEVKCLNNPNKTFKVRPKGTREHKKQLFKNANKYIGKKLTTYFYEKNSNGCVTRIKTANENPK